MRGWWLNGPLDILLMKLDLFFSAYSKVKFFVYMLQSISKDYFCFANI